MTRPLHPPLALRLELNSVVIQLNFSHLTPSLLEKPYPSYFVRIMAKNLRTRANEDTLTLRARCRHSWVSRNQRLNVCTPEHHLEGYRGRWEL
ncbi:hypothetical protein BDN70DRAFT_878331 [Pholiota conissans]|uniref:Uncharacterized protein n=1 Tax=Pholiota conissans TaxID=109636 RepID=A0A9P5Z3B5_9AGAR|nr:hypothetical protein BDN70DRAFT_878331 [Pholiota conissans]